MLTAITRPAFATEEFRKLLVEMKRRGTQTLILDSRSNPGGNSLMYGSAAVFELRHTGLKGMVPTISAAHFPDDPSKASVLPKRGVPLRADASVIGWPRTRGGPHGNGPRLDSA